MEGFDDPVSKLIIPEGEGTVLGGRFKLLRFLGSGSIGAVYEAYDANRSACVAIKVLFPALTEDSVKLEHLLATARMNSELNHPAIVTVYDTHQGNGLFWFSMELVKESSLRKLLKEGLRQN